MMHALLPSIARSRHAVASTHGEPSAIPGFAVSVSSEYVTNFEPEGQDAHGDHQDPERTRLASPTIHAMLDKR